jgi:hypothetical protein
MTRLSEFRDVHPSWPVVEAMDGEAASAAARLLMMAVMVGEGPTQPELDMLREEWDALPLTRRAGTGSFAELRQATADELAGFRREPDRFDQYLRDNCAVFSDDEEKLAVLRMVTIVLVADDFTEHEVDFCYAVGHHLGLPPDTSDAVVRAVWESRQVAKTGSRPEVPVTRPPHGYEHARERSMRPAPNPFSERPWRHEP